MRSRGLFAVAAGSAAFLLAAAGSAAPSPPSPEVVRDRVRVWRSAHEVEIVRELAGLLGVSNVASDTPNIEKSAAAVAAALERRGVRPEYLRVPGAPPVLFGAIETPGAKRTLILYAHYDGQPVDPTDWKGDPWKPILRDGPLEAGAREVPLDSLKSPVRPSGGSTPVRRATTRRRSWACSRRSMRCAPRASRSPST